MGLKDTGYDSVDFNVLAPNTLAWVKVKVKVKVKVLPITGHEGPEGE